MANYPFLPGAYNREIDSDVLAWAKVQSIDYSVDYLAGLDIFVRQLKSGQGVQRVWYKLTGVYVFCLPKLSSPTGMVLNLKGLKEQGSLVGGYTLNYESGFKFDGVTGCFDTGISGPTAFPNNSYSLLAFVNSDLQGGAGRGAMGVYDGISIVGGYPSDTFRAGFYAGAKAKVAEASKSCRGLFGIVRIDAVNCILFTGAGGVYNVAIPAVNDASTGLPHIPAETLKFGKLGNNFDPNIFSFAFRSRTSLNPADIASIRTACVAALAYFETLTFDPMPVPPTPNYWQRSDIARVRPSGIRIFRNCGVPKTNTYPAASYNYYPITDCDFQIGPSDCDGSQTQTLIKGHARIFADRAQNSLNTGKELKPTGLEQDITYAPTAGGAAYHCRLTFTTVAKANASTLAKVAYLLNFTDAQVLAYATAAGIPTTGGINGAGSRVVTTAYAAAHPDLIFNAGVRQGYAISSDWIVVGLYRITQVVNTPMGGAWLDYEVGDGRNPDDCMSVMQAISDMHVAKGYKFIIGCDNLLGAGSYGGGMRNTNLPQIMALPALDIITLTFPNDPPDNDVTAFLQNLYNQLRGPGLDQPVPNAKVALNFGLGTGASLMSPALAAQASAFATTYGLGGLRDTRSGASEGGDATQPVNITLAAYWGGIDLSTAPPPPPDGSTFDPDTKAYYARWNSAPSTTIQSYMDTFVVGMKAGTGSLWTKAALLAFFAGADSPDVLANLRSSTAISSGTLSGSFVSFTPNLGFTGNNTDSMIDWGAGVSALADPTGASMSVFVYDINSVASTRSDCGPNTLDPYNSAGQMVATPNQSATISSAAGSVTSGIGLFGWTRDGGTVKLYKGSALLLSQAAGTLSPPSGNIRSLRRDTGVSATSRQVGGHFVFSPALTDAEEATFAGLVAAYFASVTGSPGTPTLVDTLTGPVAGAGALTGALVRAIPLSGNVYGAGTVAGRLRGLS